MREMARKLEEMASDEQSETAIGAAGEEKE
jgi:hypothetical protein